MLKLTNLNLGFIPVSGLNGMFPLPGEAVLLVSGLVGVSQVYGNTGGLNSQRSALA